MINRSKMRRQLYRGGGITGLYPRQKYGIGSWVKERVRKLIPNELADVAVKAAPFVAPFYPGAAALMRGIGRFDQRGSMSDALKQGLGTYAFGKGAGMLGGAESGQGFFGGQTYTPEGFRERGLGRFLNRGETSVDAPVKSKDIIEGRKFDVTDPIGYAQTEGTGQNWITDTWNAFKGMSPGMQSAVAGGVSGALTYFTSQFPPPDPGEDMTAYRERRRVAVGKLMRQYMDNTRAYDPAWTSLTDEQKDEEVARLNKNQGGRVGYQTGGITMANTLAQNIALNRANQQAVGGMFEAARSKLPGYVPPRGELTLKDIDQTGMPRQITQEDVDTYNFIPPTEAIAPVDEGFISRPVEPDERPEMVLGDELEKAQYYTGQDYGPGEGMAYTAVMPQHGFRYAYDQEGTRHSIPIEGYEGPIGNQIMPMMGSWQDAVKGDDWETLSDIDQYHLSQEYPGQTPPRRDPNFLPSYYYNQGGRVGFNSGGLSEYEIFKLKELKYDVNKYGIDHYGGLKVLREVLDLHGYNQGGRVGLYGGGEAGIKSLDAGAHKITYEGNEGLQSNEEEKMIADMSPALKKRMMELMMQGVPPHKLREEAEKQLRQQPYIDERMGIGSGPILEAAQGGRIGYDNGGFTMDDALAEEDRKVKESLKAYERYKATGGTKSYSEFIKMTGTGNFAQGGRIGQLYGTGPAGLPGIPRRAPDGMEFDMRMNGGFQGLGAKEGKDDVPAMLAKNEFVFTADAVRGAGGGDIELGAQRMYDTMKNLEKRMA